MDKIWLKKIVDDIVESECLDMSDEFTNEEIEMILRYVIVDMSRLRRPVRAYNIYRDGEGELTIFPHHFGVPECCEFVAALKIINKESGSTVSWSTEDCTGVDDDSMYYCVMPEMDRYDIEGLLSMINKAWYLCHEC